MKRKLKLGFGLFKICEQATQPLCYPYTLMHFSLQVLWLTLMYQFQSTICKLTSLKRLYVNGNVFFHSTPESSSYCNSSYNFSIIIFNIIFIDEYFYRIFVQSYRIYTRYMYIMLSHESFIVSIRPLFTALTLW